MSVEAQVYVIIEEPRQDYGSIMPSHRRLKFPPHIHTAPQKALGGRQHPRVGINTGPEHESQNQHWVIEPFTDIR